MDVKSSKVAKPRPDKVSDIPPRGQAILRLSGTGWFLVAATGQAAFIWFIIAHYGQSSLTGDLQHWNSKPLIKGYVPGDDIGNIMFGIHVLLAAVVTLGGLYQLIPRLRQWSPVLHRWNGRIFFVIACILALGGLWLTWGRHTYLSLISGLSVSLNGVLILLCVAVAWRMAVRRKYELHRRWAMRAFLVVNGVWFLRVAIMAWAMTTGGLGMNHTLSGPADVVLQFGSYLIPLAVLEIYFRAQRNPNGRTKGLVGGLVGLMTIITAVGVIGAILFMWAPYMN